jgi:predicted nucleic acid-binding protein
MKLYLDMCCLKRPFDDQSDPRILLEAQAVETILQLCRAGQHQLVTSDALRFENSRNPNAQRKEFAEASLSLAACDQPHSTALERRAAVWQNEGVGLLDALHLASAEQAGAEAFATCDDILLKRAARVSANLRVLAVLDLFKELVP